MLSEIKDHVDSCHTNGITAKEKLAAVLRFFAEGNYQYGTGQDFHIAIAQPTFSKALAELLKVMERILCPKWIRLEMTEEEKQRAMRYFFDKTGIPRIVMCVDGTHIKLIPPKIDRNLYYNRKGFYSLNVLLVSKTTKNGTNK